MCLTPLASRSSVRVRASSGSSGIITKSGRFAYRSYDLVTEGVDRDNPREGAEVRGPMMYHFPIRGHFDVERRTIRRRVSRATCSSKIWLTANGMNARVPVDWGSNIRWRAGNGSYYIQENDDDDAGDAIRSQGKWSP